MAVLLNPDWFLMFLLFIFQTVAGGQFCEEFGLLGLPDWVVLSSDIKTKVVTDPELLNRKHSYEVIDYAALWFDEAENRKPDSAGKRFLIFLMNNYL